MRRLNWAPPGGRCVESCGWAGMEGTKRCGDLAWKKLERTNIYCMVLLGENDLHMVRVPHLFVCLQAGNQQKSGGGQNLLGHNDGIMGYEQLPSGTSM